MTNGSDDASVFADSRSNEGFFPPHSSERTSHHTDILLQLCCLVLYCGRLFKHPCGFIKIATADRINVPKGH